MSPAGYWKFFVAFIVGLTIYCEAEPAAATRRGYFAWKNATHWSCGDRTYVSFATAKDYADHRNLFQVESMANFGVLTENPDNSMRWRGMWPNGCGDAAVLRPNPALNRPALQFPITDNKSVSFGSSGSLTGKLLVRADGSYTIWGSASPGTFQGHHGLITINVYSHKPSKLMRAGGEMESVPLYSETYRCGVGITDPLRMTEFYGRIPEEAFRQMARAVLVLEKGM